MHEKIQPGFDVFLADGQKSVGAVRRVHAHGIVIYIENGGDFEVPLGAITDAHSEKVILDPGKLDPKLLQAIAGAHSGEDTNIP